MKSSLKFVSYSGEYPALCYGDLIIELDGKEINLGCCLSSGGACYFLGDYEKEVVESGPWSLGDLPKEFPKELEAQLLDLVNDEIPWGCCGGCL